MYFLKHLLLALESPFYCGCHMNRKEVKEMKHIIQKLITFFDIFSINQFQVNCLHIANYNMTQQIFKGKKVRLGHTV